MSSNGFELTDGTIDVGIVCSDFNASVEFYVQMLGLPVAADLQIPERLAVDSGLAPSAFRHLRVRAGHALIKLMEIDPPPATPRHEFGAGIRWLTLRVSDIHGTMHQLQSRGVQFLSGPLEGIAGSFVCARAPDGVIIEFVELYSATDDRP